MTNERRVLIHPDVPALVAAVAARFLTKTVDLLDEQDQVHVVLTGGTVASDVQRAIATSPMQAGIDWSRVHFWWGDERFVASDDTERNELQAREALLDHIPTPPENIHPMPASDRIADLDEAAAAYAAELAAVADDGVLPRFDITFLGVGPDGHIASLFPDRNGSADPSTTVVPVRNAPKPPPLRISLTLSAIDSSQRVWMVLSGAEKASALGLALAGASEREVPVAGVQGRKRTVFFVDQAAASQVPENLIANSY